MAESDSVGYPISCAWVRLFSSEEAGADYVGGNTPELAIAMIANAPGVGVVTRILRALLGLCESRYSGVSLSARHDKTAVRFYERLGFRRVPATPIINRVGTESVVMLLPFNQSRPGQVT